MAALILILFVFAISSAEIYELYTDKGRVVGNVYQSRNGFPYVGFEGIAYAESPVGKLRFQNPIPLKSGRDFFKTRGKLVQCVQKPVLKFGEFEGNEDCLNLSVFTPKGNLDEGNKEYLPVLAYLHGGGYKEGKPEGDASFFMDENIIVVFISYRLGFLGFMKIDENTGNVGLKDQELALDWIQKNIKLFGGDPNKVTLAGHSAGAASAHYHTLAKDSKDKFRSAILLSGSFISPWASTTASDIIDKSLQVAKSVNCSCGKLFSSSVLHCLRKISAQTLCASQDNFHFWDIDPVVVFIPTIDKRLISQGHKDIMIGYSAKEGGVKKILLKDMDDKKLNEFVQNIHNYLRRMMFYDDSLQSANLTKQVEKILFDKLDKNSVVEGLFRLYNEFFFLAPGARTAKNHKGKVYAFFNNFIDKSCDSDNLEEGKFCALHGDDLGALFKSNSKKITNEEQELFSRRLVKSWANFIKFGDPSTEEFEWKEYSTAGNYMYMNRTTFNMEKNYLKKYLDIWKDIPLNKLDDLKHI